MLSIPLAWPCLCITMCWWGICSKLSWKTGFPQGAESTVLLFERSGPSLYSSSNHNRLQWFLYVCTFIQQSLSVYFHSLKWIKWGVHTQNKVIFFQIFNHFHSQALILSCSYIPNKAEDECYRAVNLFGIGPRFISFKFKFIKCVSVFHAKKIMLLNLFIYCNSDLKQYPSLQDT